ncbi:pyridoxamine 5'-phosphate oxidase family protein [Georgenia halophila]|uniref:Pyridoxamine 5'-phosphate oxidase family protein n=1 Tax=Georgenia halophila TaxID=620889 RepID=A0ABP8L429_9MICO
MGKVHPEITPGLRDFIAAQHMFFVATAPLSGDGHVNLSPKGVAGTSVVVDERTFAYLDLTASGAETIAHLRENGRITVMFCAFDGQPNILRLYGRGRVVRPGDAGYRDWAGHFETADSPAARAVIVIDVERVSDSCGFGVPLLDYRGERDLLVGHMERKGPDGVRDYQERRNRTSIDGLPALQD